MDTMALNELVSEAAGKLREAASAHSNPAVAVVGGSGLSEIFEPELVRVSTPFAEIPGLGEGAVAGHAGTWTLLELEGRFIYFLAGRRHYYEGLEEYEPGMSMRILAELGVRRVVLTNAAGGLAARLSVGDLMLIESHLDMLFRNPLRGWRAGEAPGRRTSRDPWDPKLNAILRRAAVRAGVDLKEGVYVASPGPNYEARAEVRMMQTFGGEAAGMSTVPEALAAFEAGMRVAGISLITNSHVLGSEDPPTHEEVIREGRIAAQKMSLMLREAFGELCEA